MTLSSPTDTASSGSTASAGSTATPSSRPRTSGEPSTRRRAKKAPTKVTPAVEISIAAMGAAGVSRRQTARALKISPDTVQEVMHRPTTQGLITEMRDVIKRVALEGIKGLSQNAWAWATQIARDQRDPRAFDAVARSLLSMEKLSSSASGESRKIEGTFTHDLADPSEELSQLIQALRRGGGTPPDHVCH